MKVTKSEGFQLLEGDSITCGVTHEIKIGGEKSWVNYSVTVNIHGPVTGEQAAMALQDHVDKQVIKNIQQTVETVRNQ